MKQHRIQVVDALRGFAVMAIMFLHCIERFNLYFFPPKESLPEWLVASDSAIWDSLFFLFGGKAYAIFALLFGFTFFLQNTKQKSLGKDFGPVYLWRLFLLIGFAFLNATFFPGDVLLLFAFVGVSLYGIRNWETKSIVILTTILLLQPLEIIQYLLIRNNNETWLLSSFANGLVREHAGLFKSIVKEDQLGTTLQANFIHGQIFSFFWAIGNGRWIQTAGLFLLGISLGRTRKFEMNRETKTFWTKSLLIGILCFIPLYYLNNVKVNFLSGEELKTMGSAIGMWKNLSFTTILVSVFVLLYQYSKMETILSKLAPYGRMSLTNYISQSILGFILFFPVGFNLAVVIPNTYSFLMGIGLFLLQLWFCNWWLKSHKQGPLEALWHKWTWKFQENPKNNKEQTNIENKESIGA